MQKGPKGLLQILKNYENLQRFTLKVSRDDLNNFKSDSEPSENLFESFENVSKRKIEPKNFNEDFNENQFKTE